VTDAHSCPFWWMWERDAALAPFPGFAVIVARVRGDVAARKEALELIDLSQSRARNWRL